MCVDSSNQRAREPGLPAEEQAASLLVGGIMLELSVGADIERWPIDLAQSQALPSLLQALLRQSETQLPRAA
ncbi:hypothetical protein GCM10027280_10540 [Micromonospora polyrhachis]